MTRFIGASAARSQSGCYLWSAADRRPPASPQCDPRQRQSLCRLSIRARSRVAAGSTSSIARAATASTLRGAPDWQQPDARGDLPPPPHDDTGHTWRHADAQLTEIIRGGLRDQFNKTPELTMPPFQTDQLSEREISDVIAYFKRLWSAEHQQFQEEQNRRPPTPMLSPSPEGGR